MTPVEKLLTVARAEIGYLEKASNRYLDEKTANSGFNNWTKYARDLDSLGFYHARKNGYAWCAVFCDWCFTQAFGYKMALKMTGQNLGGYGAGCTESVRYYKQISRFYKSSPRPGDQIFFTNDGGKTFNHTGLVEKVKDGRVYTIEGNTSAAAGVVANGGAVAKKSYVLNYIKIGGYGRPDYSLIEEEIDMTIDGFIEKLTPEQAYLLVAKAAAHASTLPEPKWSKDEGYWAKAEMNKILSGNPEGHVKRDELAAVLGRLNLF